MGKGNVALIIVLLFFYVLLLAMDLFANLVLGWIPWMGAILETMTESVIEIVQLIIIIIIGLLGMKEEVKGEF